MIASLERDPRRILAVGGRDLLGPFLIRPASVAHLLVKGHDMSALRALAIDLLVLEAPEQRGDGAEHRDDRPDREPEQERAALPAADQAGRKAAEEANDEVAHGSRS